MLPRFGAAFGASRSSAAFTGLCLLSSAASASDKLAINSSTSAGVGKVSLVFSHWIKSFRYTVFGLLDLRRAVFFTVLALPTPIFRGGCANFPRLWIRGFFIRFLLYTKPKFLRVYARSSASDILEKSGVGSIGTPRPLPPSFTACATISWSAVACSSIGGASFLASFKIPKLAFRSMAGELMATCRRYPYCCSSAILAGSVVWVRCH